MSVLDALTASAQGDPFKTLFVGRLSFDATDKKLQREFGEFGPIKSIRLVHDKDSGWPTCPAPAFTAVD